MSIIARMLLVLSHGLTLVVWLSSAYDLTILHTNDVHAHFDQFDKYGSRCDDEESANGQCFGGVARRVTKVREIRSEVDNVVLLDAGDQYQGSVWFSFYKGLATSHFMNILGYDAMTLGNHEFDNGPEGLTQFLKDIDARVVCANLDASNEPAIDGLFTKSAVLEVGGEKIGIVGYTFSHMEMISLTVGNLVFMNEVSSIQAEVDRLIADEGVDKMIALGHSGYDADLKIAREVRGLDVVVGGHSNTFLYTDEPPGPISRAGPYPTVVHPDADPTANVLVVQDYKFGTFLGRLDVTFDDGGKVTGWGGNPILMNKDVEEDAAVLEELNVLSEAFRDQYDRHIATTNVLLDEETCRRKECSMGNLLADAYLRQGVRATVNGVRVHDAHMALVNAGETRGKLTVGDITAGDIERVLSFSGTVDQVTLKGVHVLEALEHSAAMYREAHGTAAFLQVAGMLVSYDLSRRRGNRVVSAEVRCTECEVPEFQLLDLDKEYRISLSSYLASGGDGYTMILDNIITHEVGIKPKVDVVTDYVQLMSPLTNGPERRITFIEPLDVKDLTIQCFKLIMDVFNTKSSTTYD